MGDGDGRRRRVERHGGGGAERRGCGRACGAGAAQASAWTISRCSRPRRTRRPSRRASAPSGGPRTAASVCGRAAAMTSGPNVRLGTNWPSITSHWMRSTPASSSAATSSPSRAKSAGSTLGAISIGRVSGTSAGYGAGPAPAVGSAGWRLASVLTIERVVAGGAGLAHGDDGRVVFVDGALPGETVAAAVDRRAQATSPAPRSIEVLDAVAGPGGAAVPAPGRRLWRLLVAARRAGGAARAEGRHRARRPAAHGPAARRGRRVAGAVAAVGLPHDAAPGGGPDGRLGLRRAASHDVVVARRLPGRPPGAQRAARRPCRRRRGGEVTLRVERGAPARRRRCRRTATDRSGTPPRRAGLDPQAMCRRAAGLVTRTSPARGCRSAAAASSSPARRRPSCSSPRSARPSADQRGRFVDAYGGVGLFAATVARPTDDVVVVESSPSACADARVNLAGRQATVVESPCRALAAVAGRRRRRRPGPTRAQRDGAADARRRPARGGSSWSAATRSRCARDAALLAGHGYAPAHRHASSTCSRTPPTSRSSARSSGSVIQRGPSAPNTWRAQPDPSTLSDAALRWRMARYQQDALAEAYRRHAGAVFGLAKRLLGSQAQAEEVVQEIFLRLWNQPERFDPERGSLRSFLLTQTHGRPSTSCAASPPAAGARSATPPNAPAVDDIDRELWNMALAEHVRQAIGRAARRRAPGHRAGLLRRAHLPRGGGDARRSRGDGQEPDPGRPQAAACRAGRRRCHAGRASDERAARTGARRRSDRRAARRVRPRRGRRCRAPCGSRSCCASIRVLPSELDEHRETAAALAWSSTDAPPGLWDRDRRVARGAAACSLGRPGQGDAACVAGALAGAARRGGGGRGRGAGRPCSSSASCDVTTVRRRCAPRWSTPSTRPTPGR